MKLRIILSNMKLILMGSLFVIFVSWATNQNQNQPGKQQGSIYKADYYHSSSFASNNVIEPKGQPISKIHCAAACEKEASCDKFSFKGENCLLIGKTSSLVEASKYSQKATRVWSKGPVETVTHFMIFHSQNDMKIEDWSTDPTASPAIDTNDFEPTSGSFRSPCGIYFPSEQKAIFRYVDKPEAYEWYLFQDKPKLLPEFNDTYGHGYRGCATSNTGKLFVYTGGITSSVYLYHDGQSRIMDVPSEYNRDLTCVAFHPDNDNIVYVFGGSKNLTNLIPQATAFSLDLQQSDIIPMPIESLKTPLLSPGCLGYHDVVGHGRILIAGGRPTTSADATSEVWDYDIIKNEYIARSPLPVGLTSIRLTLHKDVMWILSASEFKWSIPSRRIFYNYINVNDTWHEIPTTNQKKLASRESWAFAYNLKKDNTTPNQ